jgi:hypothetical protein
MTRSMRTGTPQVVTRPGSRGVWRDLRGLDLICHCLPDEPSHADVLLELANGV